MHILSDPAPTSYSSTMDVPIPGEYVRAGGGVGTAITIEGADANGGLTYTASTASVRVKQLGGVAQVLAVSVVGTDITVQLGTDGGGVVTSDANAVKVAFDAVAAAVALGSIAVTGTGAGLAAVSPNSDWVQLSDGVDGSVRVPFETTNSRTWWLANHPSRRAPFWYWSDATTTVKFQGLWSLDSIRIESTTETYTPGALANSTWYYVYARVSAGAVAYDHSTTGPDTYGIHMQGDTTRQYIGCFKSDGGGAIIPFRSCGGRYTWLEPQQVLSGGVATVATDVSLAAYVPPHVTDARLYMQIVNGAGATNYVAVRPDGTSVTFSQKVVTSGTDADGERDVSCDFGTRIMDYFINSAAGASSANIYVAGFYEP